MGEIFVKSKKKFGNFFECLFHSGNGNYLGTTMIYKAKGVRKSLFRVSAQKLLLFFSHIFAFALVIGTAWKAKHTQQWIHLFMENPMV